MGTGLVSIVLLSTALVLWQSSLNPGALAVRDGFNMYKDLLRGKSEESDEADESEEEIRIPKLIYFYRTPPLNPDSAPDQRGAFGKRTNMNQFKSLMIGREYLDDPSENDHLAGKGGGHPSDRLLKRDVNGKIVEQKRGLGSAISWALINRRPYVQTTDFGLRTP